jgi:putative ABC transport system permease protein
LTGVDGVAVFAGGGFSSLIGSSGSEVVRVLRVSNDYLSTLAVQPSLGRGFTVSEERNEQAVAVVSARLWQRQAPGPLTERALVRIDGRPYSVVGVMPPGFVSYPQADIWIPLGRDEVASRGRNLSVLIRVKVGSPLAQLQAQVEQAVPALRSLSALDVSEQLRVVSLRAYAAQEVDTAVWALGGISGLLLLTTCVYSGLLLTAWTTTRTREIHVRGALGATPLRVTAEVTSAVGVLWIIATGLAVLASWWSLRALPVWNADWGFWTPGFFEPANVAAAATATLVVFAAVVGPTVLFTWRESRRRGADEEELHTFRTVGAGQRASWFSLVPGIAAAAALMIVAAVFVSTVSSAYSTDVGFRADDIWLARITLRNQRLTTPGALAAVYARMSDEVLKVAGVTRVEGTSVVPLERGLNVPFAREGGDRWAVDWRYVTAGYFELMGIPMVSGRTFGPLDVSGGLPVAVVNQAFQERFFQGEQPVGQLVPVFGTEEPTRILGVVADVKGEDVTGPARPTIFVPTSQAATELVTMSHRFFMPALTVRFSGQALDIRSVEVALARVSDDILLARLEPASGLIARATQESRVQLMLFAVFAGIAIAVTLVGTYAASMHSVIRRRGEIAVRLAMGATTRWLVQREVWRAVRQALCGSIVGSLAAAWLLAGLETPQTAPAQPIAQLGVYVTALLVATAVGATVLPAWRYSKRISVTAVLRDG